MLEGAGSTGLVKINNEYINPTTIAKIKKDTKDKGSIVTYTTETPLGNLSEDYIKKFVDSHKNHFCVCNMSELIRLKVPDVEPEVLANATNTAMQEGRIVDVMA